MYSSERQLLVGPWSTFLQNGCNVGSQAIVLNSLGGMAEGFSVYSAPISAPQELWLSCPDPESPDHPVGGVQHLLQLRKVGVGSR